jgi:hypothetical protein
MIIKFIVVFFTLLTSIYGGILKDIQNKPLLQFDNKKNIIDVFDNWKNCDESKWLENKDNITFKCVETPSKNYSATIVKNLGEVLSLEKQDDINFYTLEKQKLENDLIILEKKIKATQSIVKNTNSKKEALKEEQAKIEENRKKQEEEKQQQESQKNHKTTSKTENAAIRDMEADFKKWDKEIEQENIRQEKEIYQSKIKDFIDKNQGDNADISTQKELIEQTKKWIKEYEIKIAKISSKNSDIAKTTDIKEVQQLFDFSIKNDKVVLDSIRTVIFWNDGKRVIYFNKLSFARYVYKNTKLYYRDISSKRKAKSAYRFFKKMKKR